MWVASGEVHLDCGLRTILTAVQACDLMTRQVCFDDKAPLSVLPAACYFDTSLCLQLPTGCDHEQAAQACDCDVESQMHSHGDSPNCVFALGGGHCIRCDACPAQGEELSGVPINACTSCYIRRDLLHPFCTHVCTSVVEGHLACRKREVLLSST